jgi:eukaryotic-like serine/threonine-protein kinase
LAPSGVYDAPGVRGLPKIKWKFPAKGQLISSPAGAGGLLYIGNRGGNLYPIEIESGEQKWKFETHARITSSRAVDRGAIYFASYDGKFYAGDAASGKLKWRFQSGGERRFARQASSRQSAGSRGHA